MSVSDQTLVHLCSRNDWRTAQANGEYRAESLDSEGFIHCSRPNQILQVANSFYQGGRDLVLLWIDPALVEPEIRWDPVGNETFPHIYGPINLSAIVGVSDFPADPDGIFRRIEKP